jgi:DNA polymerase-3 subunit epsilon
MSGQRPRPPWPEPRRRTWRDVELVALDFETTGLDFRRAAVVSFGLVPVIGGRIDLAGLVYREVAPSAPPSHSSIAVHHLRPQDLAQAQPLAEVTEDLETAIEGRHLLTWMAEVETTLLARIFGRSPRQWARRTIDVWRLSLIAYDALADRAAPRSHGLAATAVAYGVPREEAHNALNDALMTAELFLVLASKLAPLGYGEVRRLVRATRVRRRPFELASIRRRPAP